MIGIEPLAEETKIKKKDVAVSGNRLYWPMCSVCQYMKRNKEFSQGLILSTYFNPRGMESLPEVLRRFNDPFVYVTVQQHCIRHMKGNLWKWRKRFGIDEKKKWQKAMDKTKELELINNTLEVVETATESNTAHEQGLDAFIAKGTEMVNNDRMPITANTYIQAIKAKAEIENKTKDRRFDAMRALFSGMGPKDEDKTV